MEKNIPYGKILGIFFCDEIVLIVTPACCILMNMNLEEKKSFTNRYPVDCVLSESDRKQNFLFIYKIDSSQPDGREF